MIVARLFDNDCLLLGGVRLLLLALNHQQYFDAAQNDLKDAL